MALDRAPMRSMFCFLPLTTMFSFIRDVVSVLADDSESDTWSFCWANICGLVTAKKRQQSAIKYGFIISPLINGQNIIKDEQTLLSVVFSFMNYV